MFEDVDLARRCRPCLKMLALPEGDRDVEDARDVDLPGDGRDVEDARDARCRGHQGC